MESAGYPEYTKGGGDVDNCRVYCCENMLRSSKGMNCIDAACEVWLSKEND